MPLFRGSSRFESLILSHHARFTCECNKEEINDDDDAPPQVAELENRRAEETQRLAAFRRPARRARNLSKGS